MCAGLTSATKSEKEAGETTGLGAAPPNLNRRKPEPGETVPVAQLGHLDEAVLAAVRGSIPLLAIPQANTLSDGVARQLVGTGAFTYNGAVGDFRAPLDGKLVLRAQSPALRAAYRSIR